MHKKLPTYLHRDDEGFETKLEAMQHLRKLFLAIPFEEFVNLDKLRQSLPENDEMRKYLKRLDARLDFGTDSFRYHMLYLKDAKTAKVADKYSYHDIHTDFRGRCEIDDAHKALGYAMGFICLDENLEVEKLGYDHDPGHIEETISTKIGDVQISGYKNAKGNYHGYCQLLYDDGTIQKSFFDDGKILAGQVHYTNGVHEDIADTERNNIIVDRFANRTAYEIITDNDRSLEIKEINIERGTAEEITRILSDYTLCMECDHEKSYPYEDGTHWETASDWCVPGINMAILKDGKLWGVALKTNEYEILPLESEKSSLNNNWENYAVALDEELTDGDLKISLRKKC